LKRKYLGLKLERYMEDLYAERYQVLRKEIIKDPNKWRCTTLMD
jgi:hypothetical protein